jgi:hypothetical protein
MKLMEQVTDDVTVLEPFGRLDSTTAKELIDRLISLQAAEKVGSRGVWSVILCICVIPTDWGRRCAGKINGRKVCSATYRWNGALRRIIRCA